MNRQHVLEIVHDQSGPAIDSATRSGMRWGLLIGFIAGLVIGALVTYQVVDRVIVVPLSQGVEV